MVRFERFYNVIGMVLQRAIHFFFCNVIATRDFNGLQRDWNGFATREFDSILAM